MTVLLNTNTLYAVLLALLFFTPSLCSMYLEYRNRKSKFRYVYEGRVQYLMEYYRGAEELANKLGREPTSEEMARYHASKIYRG